MAIVESDVCVIGLGPAGLGAALELAENGLKVACIEAGEPASDKRCTILEGKGCRKADPCHITGGVGGSAGLAGGKLSEYPAGRALAEYLPSSSSVQSTLREALGVIARYIPLHQNPTAGISIEEHTRRFSDLGLDLRYYPVHRYDQRDFVSGCAQMLGTVVDRGGEVHLQTIVRTVHREGDSWRVVAVGRSGQLLVRAKQIIVAGGRSCGPLLMGLKEHLVVEGNAPEVGVRLEFPATAWPDLADAHDDLKLLFGQYRTFCVCYEGVLAPYRWRNIFLLEGHSELGKKTGFSNLGINVRLPRLSFEDLVEFSDEMNVRSVNAAGGLPGMQPLSAYLDGRVAGGRAINSSIRYWKAVSLRQLFPDTVATGLADAVGQFVDRVPFDIASSNVFAPAFDYFWPSVVVGSGFKASGSGLYVVGDAVGRFRGILQAFAAGRCAAQSVVNG